MSNKSHTGNSHASDVIKAGIRMTVKYGRHVMALKSSIDNNVNNLSAVVAACNKMLNDQQTYSLDYSEFNHVDQFCIFKN